MNDLLPEERMIIVGKGTEAPFSGEYDNFYKEGTYVCRRCNAPLFSAKSKFDAGCGWPSFDENLPAGRQGFPDAVKRVPDADGMRTEIRCANCDGHLGHVFTGEHMTDKDTRHCVNSLSIRFFPEGSKMPEVFHE
ncbi:MAG: methionine-R-sulfoxide reductase [bacterium]|nr:methionine-R-sulfoxide reductase [bacterium]